MTDMNLANFIDTFSKMESERVRKSIKEKMNKRKERKTELVDCTNYFNDVGCSRLVKELENGKAVRIYIDCIGHTTTHRETLNYVEWLIEKYGDKLVKDNESGFPVYYLKD